MTLDSSVMNVSIATVADDVGTTVTGIQTAITFYTLVMASLMITGGKIGQIIGRKRGVRDRVRDLRLRVVLTAIAPNLAVLMLGWSVLEGVGAALILPAIVALVASNFGRAERPRAYGLVASAGAIAVAAGPLIGGLFTTYASWRWVFAGEVLIVAVILVLTRRMADVQPGGAGAARSRGHRAVGPRPRPRRVRDPQVGGVGVRPGEAVRSGMARALPRRLADPRRRRCPVDVHVAGRVGSSPAGPNLSSTRRSSRTGCCAAA